MCTTSEVAAQQIKKIQSSEDKAEDDKKFVDRKNAPRQKSDDEQTKSGVETCSGFTCKYCGRQQRHVKRTECRSVVVSFGKICSNCENKGPLLVRLSRREESKSV